MTIPIPGGEAGHAASSSWSDPVLAAGYESFFSVRTISCSALASYQ